MSSFAMLYQVRQRHDGKQPSAALLQKFRQSDSIGDPQRQKRRFSLIPIEKELDLLHRSLK